MMQDEINTCGAITAAAVAMRCSATALSSALMLALSPYRPHISKLSKKWFRTKLEFRKVAMKVVGKVVAKNGQVIGI